MPKYAGLGHEGSIWVPIVEKAYCFFRKQVSTYSSIASRQRLRGRTPQRLQPQQDTGGTVTASQVIAWDPAGRPPGAIATEIRTVPSSC